MAGLVAAGCRRSDKAARASPADAPGSPSVPDPSLSASGSADPDPPPPPSGPSLVDLHGGAHLPPPIAEGAPRLGSTLHAHRGARPPRPQRQQGRVPPRRRRGRDRARRAGQGGLPGAAQAQPYGFACVGPEATLDVEHPIVRALTRRPDISQKLPYMYGIATRGGPVYARIPTAEQTKEYEPSLKKHLASGRRTRRAAPPMASTCG